MFALYFIDLLVLAFMIFAIVKMYRIPISESKPPVCDHCHTQVLDFSSPNIHVLPFYKYGRTWVALCDKCYKTKFIDKSTYDENGNPIKLHYDFTEPDIKEVWYRIALFLIVFELILLFQTVIILSDLHGVL